MRTPTCLAVTLVLCLSACGEQSQNSDSAPGDQHANIGMEDGKPGLSNQDRADENILLTGFQVHSGDTLEIEPAYLLKETRLSPEPKSVQVDNSVCVATEDVCVQSEPVYERRCGDSCHVCIQCHAFPPGCFPDRCCDNVCQDVKTGDRCVRTETRCKNTQNQWRKITTFEEPTSSSVDRNDSPMNDVQSLIDGLKIRTYDLADGKASRGTSCPLKRFNPKLTAKTISLSLTNAPDCDALFHDNADQRLGLELVNEVQFPTPYRKGIMVESWDHQILQSPLESMFWPRVEFGGSILIRSVQH